MSWPRQGSQNTLDNPEFERKSWISWVWGFEVVHAKGSFEVALPPNASVCQCHFARMHCLRVGCFAKTLGLSKKKGATVTATALHCTYRYRYKYRYRWTVVWC